MKNRIKILTMFALVMAFTSNVFSQKANEIIKQERYFYDTLKAKKMHLLPELFSKNFHGVFGGGYIDKKAEVEGFKSAVLLDYKFSEIIVKFPAKNLGIMMYRSYIKGSSKGKTVTGESYRTSTWVKKRKKWQMILHTDVPVRDAAKKKNTNEEFVGIGTIIYRVKDLKAAIKWYSEAFGQKPYFNEPYYVGFNINGYELGLQPEEAESHKNKSDASVPLWVVTDIDKTYKKMIDLGAKSHEKPTGVGGDLKVATVIDPWGNFIGLIYNPSFKK